ncbi:MAG: ribulose-phosphate 3-epimerase [Planctomycetales bacterium]
MSRHQRISDLHTQGPTILPSLLMCDFGNLAAEIEAVEAAGVRALELDVMDGQCVPKLSEGLTIVEAVRRITDLPLDVHLMISNPDPFLRRYYEAGADQIIVHVEATDRPVETLQQIRQLGAAVGLALNPPTPLEDITAYVDLCDLILVMSVMPGFGGQEFDPAALDKLSQLRKIAGDTVTLGVDGGINIDTIGKCAGAGAQWFVAGSAIFGKQDYASSVSTLLELATPSFRS